jgi:uncharacterized membrane protein YvlD (DUF360 family)
MCGAGAARDGWFGLSGLGPLGLVAIVVNGPLLWLTSYVAYDKPHEPFRVAGFVAAVKGALIVGMVTWVIPPGRR